MPKIAFIFPGQGSQKVGMGRAWAEAFPAAQAAFEEADAALAFPLSKLCWEGPEEELGLTANTQPAILAVSVAIHRVVAELMAELDLRPMVFAGHSLGEYSAHVAAGTLSFADALCLVRRRGELMQDAVPLGHGGMAVLIGLSDPVVEEVVALARQDLVCAVANLNSPGQTVIAGHLEAVQRVVDLAKERKAKRAKLLPVSAPFHSPLMLPARQGLAPLLRATNMAAPAAPVVSNVDATPVLTGPAARDTLERQVDGTVRWVESVEYMARDMGAEIFVEIGPGNVLTGIGRRMITEATWLSLPKPEALEMLAAKLKEASAEDLSGE